MDKVKTTKQKEPLFHIIKNNRFSVKQSILVRVIAILVTFIVCGLVAYLLTSRSPFEFYKALFTGCFSTPKKIWQLFYNTAMLLLVALALTPAFKMRFWNIGAQGQILVGGLATYICMMYLGNTLPLPVLWIVMIASSILASVIWAIIPTLFKAKWNANETLFTLMMNYVAIKLVEFFTNYWNKTTGSQSLQAIETGAFPAIFGNQWLLNIIVVIVIAVFMYFYLYYSKHGYEISVVGESSNTAKYIGINVKKVIIRTMILSGVIMGIAGVLFVGGEHHLITTEIDAGYGFTAILVSWLAKFNPIFMVLASFLVAFLQKGSASVSTNFRIDGSVGNIITAIVIFAIVGCEFFINYKVVFRNSKKEVK